MDLGDGGGGREGGGRGQGYVSSVVSKHDTGGGRSSDGPSEVLRLVCARDWNLELEGVEEGSRGAGWSWKCLKLRPGV